MARASREVSGKRVLVTGASSGIGAAVARELAAAGATVGICARRKELLEAVLADCKATSPASRMWVVDLVDLDGLEAFAAEADEALGGIDVLVNNAGMPKRRGVLDLTPQVVEHVMALNYLSPVRLTLALLPRMIGRGYGRIVNVSSVAAQLSPPHEAAYAASKAALTAFAESALVDLADEPIRIHNVYPGIIDTELFHLPDNEPSMSSGIEAIPAEQLAQAMLDQLDAGALDLHMPEWFAEVAARKARDNAAFLDGSKSFMRSQLRSG